MIAERARHLTLDIRALEETRRRFEHLEAFQTRLDALTTLLARLRPLLAVLRHFRRHGIRVSIARDALRNAADRVGQLQQAIRESAHPTLASPRFNTMIAPAERVRSDLEAAVTVAWREHATAHKPAIDRQVLAVLRTLRGFEVKVRRIEDILNTIEAAAEVPPRTPDEIVSFESSVTNAENAWRTLGGDTVPAEVLTFLHDAGTRGAVLNQLTNEVRDWLQAHKLLDRVRIQLVRNP